MNLASKMRRRGQRKTCGRDDESPYPYVEKLNIELPVGNTVPE